MSNIPRDDEVGSLGHFKDDIVSDYDLDMLLKESVGSDDGESFFVVVRGVNFRIGLNVNILVSGEVIFRIEFLLKLFSEGCEVSPEKMKNFILVQKDLSNEGYSIRHEVGGWIDLEKTVTRSQIRKECSFLLNYLLEHRILDDINGRRDENGQNS